MSTADREQSSYNREYYDAHKDEISRKRKQKYHSRQGYREEVKARARNYYDKNKKSPDKKVGYTVKVSPDGVQLFSITHLCNMVGRRADFIRECEKSGVIPKTTYTDSRGWRLYTLPQVTLIEHCIKMLDSKAWTKGDMADYLAMKWKATQPQKGEGSNA